MAGVYCQCTRGIGHGIYSSAEIQSLLLAEHQHEMLQGHVLAVGSGVVGEGLVVMSTTCCAGMTHRI